MDTEASRAVYPAALPARHRPTPLPSPRHADNSKLIALCRLLGRRILDPKAVLEQKSVTRPIARFNSWGGDSLRRRRGMGATPSSQSLTCHVGSNASDLQFRPAALQNCQRPSNGIVKKAANHARRLTPPAGGSVYTRTICGFPGAIPGGCPAQKPVPRRVVKGLEATSGVRGNTNGIYRDTKPHHNDSQRARPGTFFSLRGNATAVSSGTPISDNPRPTEPKPGVPVKDRPAQLFSPASPTSNVRTYASKTSKKTKRQNNQENNARTLDKIAKSHWKTKWSDRYSCHYRTSYIEASVKDTLRRRLPERSGEVRRRVQASLAGCHLGLILLLKPPPRRRGPPQTSIHPRRHPATIRTSRDAGLLTRRELKSDYSVA